ncbi:MAG: acyl-[acyl-carrier-protein]--UDP-N-acetylglucosamine O-acyltransferase [Verrucomicrobiales bacterium]|nr:acyl-[acyl-carrier-protein]--UDP-N-acetylglucosamine O-acyltransferase [Verrucomicrobiales bacterium]|tara:strand:- start:198 stop:968 length:771 start_codon:yes stop_codon:yes gene_type:complete
MSIHPSAVIHENAVIGEDCEIGPYCVVGERVTLGRACRLHSHVVIDGCTVLGAENEIYPFASIGLRTQDLKWSRGETWTRIGDGNTLREYVTIHSATNDGEATVLGSGNNLLAYAHVAHDCQLGNHIIMSNVATLAGHVEVEDHAIIGGVAAVHQFCRIGTMSIIGGCSKVVQDVPPYMLADGNPAATRTLNKEGLKRNNIGEPAQKALKLAHRVLFRSEMNFSRAIEKAKAEIEACPEVKHLLEFVQSSQRGIAK